MISISLQFGIFTIFGLLNGYGPIPIGGFSNDKISTGWITNVFVLVLELLLNFYWMGVTAKFAMM